jgi:hypothetical protein
VQLGLRFSAEKGRWLNIAPVVAFDIYKLLLLIVAVKVE